MTVADQKFDHRLLRDHAFGIVTPASIVELPPGITVNPLVPRDLAASAHLMPGLIDLRTLPQDQADALLDSLHLAHVSGTQPSVQMLLATNTDIDSIAAHWNARQLVSPQSGAKSWFRLHDSRVLHQVLRILAPNQRAALFGPVQAMTYWVSSMWMRADASGQTAELSSGQMLPAARQWDWDRIGHIGVINRALQGSGVAAKDLHRQGTAVEQLIARARLLHGLNDKGDLVEFATRGLTAGPTFDMHPQVAAAIRLDGKDDDSALADRLALIDAEVWRELRRGALATQAFD